LCAKNISLKDCCPLTTRESVINIDANTSDMTIPNRFIFSILLKLICHGSIPLLGSSETLAACTRRRVVETRSFTMT
jgi:hypothetical protein